MYCYPSRDVQRLMNFCFLFRHLKLNLMQMQTVFKLLLKWGKVSYLKLLKSFLAFNNYFSMFYLSIFFAHSFIKNLQNSLLTSNVVAAKRPCRLGLTSWSANGRTSPQRVPKRVRSSGKPTVSVCIPQLLKTWNSGLERFLILKILNNNY